MGEARTRNNPSPIQREGKTKRERAAQNSAKKGTNQVKNLGKMTVSKSSNGLERGGF